MLKEIEIKALVPIPELSFVEEACVNKIVLAQFYLDSARTERIRIKATLDGVKAIRTIKKDLPGPDGVVVRSEKETTIPIKSLKNWNLLDKPGVIKIRYKLSKVVPATVDYFITPTRSVMLLEVEFPTEEAYTEFRESGYLPGIEKAAVGLWIQAIASNSDVSADPAWKNKNIAEAIDIEKALAKLEKMKGSGLELAKILRTLR